MSNMHQKSYHNPPCHHLIFSGQYCARTHTIHISPNSRQLIHRLTHTSHLEGIDDRSLVISIVIIIDDCRTIFPLSIQWQWVYTKNFGTYILYMILYCVNGLHGVAWRGGGTFVSHIFARFHVSQCVESNVECRMEWKWRCVGQLTHAALWKGIRIFW